MFYQNRIKIMHISKSNKVISLKKEASHAILMFYKDD